MTSQSMKATSPEDGELAEEEEGFLAALGMTVAFYNLSLKSRHSAMIRAS
jgi:hypothetical protein